MRYWILSSILSCWLFLGWVQVSYADDAWTIDSIFNDVHDGITQESQDMSGDGEEIDLPTYEGNTHSNAYGEDGLSIITSGVYAFLDFLKLIVAPIAVLMMVVMGVRMVIAGKDNETVMSASKNFIRYSAEGLVFIILATTIVQVFFGPEGEIFRGGTEGAQEFGRKAGSLFEGLYSLAQVIIGSVAVFVLITAGFRFVAGSTSEDEVATAKRQIIWSSVGLFVIAISEYVVKKIIFVDEGTSLGVAEADALFKQLTNFIAGTIGTLSFVFMLYAGYLYVTAVGDEDKVADAKRIMKGAAIGILLAASAFALTSTLITLDVG